MVQPLRERTGVAIKTPPFSRIATTKPDKTLTAVQETVTVFVYSANCSLLEDIPDIFIFWRTYYVMYNYTFIVRINN